MAIKHNGKACAFRNRTLLGVVACGHCGTSSTPDINRCPSCGKDKRHREARVMRPKYQD